MDVGVTRQRGLFRLGRFGIQHGDEAGAEALRVTIVLVAVRLIDLPLATQFSFLGPDANAVGLDRAVAAPLAHCRIDEHALCGIGELAALAPTSLFGGAGPLVHNDSDAGTIAQLPLEPVDGIAMVESEIGRTH